MISNPKKNTPVQEIQIIQEIIVKSNGDTALKKYVKGKFLGKGGFATVYEFKSMDNSQVYAGKIISKSIVSKSRAKQKLMFEIKIHRALHHTHIVRFQHYFEDSDNIYIFLELCSNQTLNELMTRRKRLTEIEIQCYICQLVSALKYLHSNRIIHRDIKLGNLFLNEKMELKIGDFGLATKLEFEGERKRTICGTPNYIAPEIIDGRHGHSYEVDLWSLGVLIYTLSVGKPPFETNDIKLTYKKIKSGAYVIPDASKISIELIDLISQLLVNDVSARLTLDEVLEHPFMTRNAIPKLIPASSLAVPPSGGFINQYQPLGSSLDSRPLSRSSCSKSEELKSGSNKESSERALLDTGRETPQKSNLFGGVSNRKIATLSVYDYIHTASKIWVKKWVDYSDKYGLGYILSNGNIGVHFNDNTKILSQNTSFFYITKKENSQEDLITNYSFETFPIELKKKIALLEHFKKYLEIDKIIPTDPADVVYIRRWIATEYSIIFRLSNKVVQMQFTDKSEIILCNTTKTVAFVNKLGVMSIHPLKNALESNNKELTKRLSYAAEIIANMLGPQTARS
jgi:polo-like kinase 1